MASALETLSRAMQRRLLWAYVARELGWRVMVVLLAVMVARIFAGAWMLPWAVIVAASVDWMMRWRPPGQLASAIEIDRQLALKELISTGLMARNGGLAAAARQQAEEAARSIDVGRVQAGRTGLRFWIASLLLLGVIAAMPEGSVRRDWREELGGSSARPGNDAEEREGPVFARPAARSRPGVIGEAKSDFASAAGTSAETAGGSGGDRPSRSEGDVQGSGGGLATGGQAAAPEAPGVSSAARAGGDGDGGVGAGEVAGQDGGSAGAGTIAAGAARPSPGSDEATAGVGDQGASSLQAVPPAYRGIIKAYYAR